MGEVHPPVLEDVLRMHLQPSPIQRGRGNGWVVVGGSPVVAERLEHVGGDLEVGRSPFGVVPDPHRLVPFDDGIAADAPPLVGTAFVGNAHVAPLAVPLPAVERTHEVLAFDVAAVSQVCAEVLAVRVEHRDPSGLCPPRDHFAPEVLHPADGADLDLGAPGDLEPACRLHGQGWFRQFGPPGSGAVPVGCVISISERK